MGSEMSMVIPNLYVGGLRDEQNKEKLIQQGITHVLSVHDNATPSHEGFTYKCIQVSDVPSTNLRPYFKESIQFIHECRSSGGRALVHCIAGMSRSSTLTIAYVMAICNLDWVKAMNAVRHARPCTAPNVGFQNQLRDFSLSSELSEIREALRKQFPSYNYASDERYVNQLLVQREAT